jgi:hypothetical protein
MKYLDEVGALGSDYDKRTSVDLGLAAVSSEGGDTFRFEGRDVNGDPWLVWLPQTGERGGAEVWTADFDHNGQRDLLISSLSTTNGRCTLHANLLFLLFDTSGRPVPWYVRTEVPSLKPWPYVPAVLLDVNHNGRAEVIPVACEYNQEGFWTDWSIKGIYEARDTQWLPLQTSNLAPYLHATTAAYGEDRWLNTPSSEWPDQSKASHSGITLEELIPPDENCHGVRIPTEVVDGQVRIAVTDPCDESKYEHALYSDGRRRRGWPWVVIDGAHEREIFVANNEDALRGVIREGYPVKLLGDDKEPSWLWAEETQAIVPLP